MRDLPCLLSNQVHTGSGWKSHFGGADLQFLELNGCGFSCCTHKPKRNLNFGQMNVLNVMVGWNCWQWMLFVITMGTIISLNLMVHLLRSLFNLEGSAIGIKSQFWKEDSEAIVELTLDKMNRVYCPQVDGAVDGQNISTGMSVEDWLKRNQEREKQLTELRKLKLEIEYERRQQKVEESDSPDFFTVALPYATSLILGIGVGIMVAKRVWYE